MDVVTAMLVSSLLIVPASDGTLLLKEVSTEQLDMDWTEIVPGIEVMIQGTVHSSTLLFATAQPGVVRFVGLSMFHGTLGIRGFVPGLGFLTIVSEIQISEVRIHGTGVLDPVTGLVFPLTATLSVRLLGVSTLTIGDVVVTEAVNGLIVIAFEDGDLASIRIGVPMGWPFQPFVPFP